MAAGPLTEETFSNKPPEETDEQFVEHSLSFSSSTYDRNRVSVRQGRFPRGDGDSRRQRADVTLRRLPPQFRIFPTPDLIVVSGSTAPRKNIG